MRRFSIYKSEHCFVEFTAGGGTLMGSVLEKVRAVRPDCLASSDTFILEFPFENKVAAATDSMAESKERPIDDKELSDGLLGSLTSSLADLVHDIGYPATESEDTFREVLSLIGNEGREISPKDAIRLIVMMAHTASPKTQGAQGGSGSGPASAEETVVHELNDLLFSSMSGILGESKSRGAKAILAAAEQGGAALSEDSSNRAKAHGAYGSDGTTWNVSVVQSVLQLDYIDAGKFAWKQVFEALDSDGIGIADASAFRFIANFHRRVLRSPLPIGMLLRRWNNRAGQLAVLRQAISCKEVDLVNWNGAKDLPRVSPVEGSKASTGGLNAPWFCVRVVETLLSLAETEQYQVVQSAFEYPLKSCPDVLAMSLAAVSHHGASWKWDGLRRQLISMLFAQYVSPSPLHNAAAVLRRLWGPRRGQSLMPC